MGGRPKSQTKTWGQLAVDLGISQGYLSKLRRRPWWPKGATPDDVDACRAAMARHVQRAGEETPAAPAGAAPSRELGPEDLALLDLLRGSDAAPLDVARAAVRVASRQLAHGLEHGSATTRDLEGLAKTLQELRRSEAGWLSLEEKRGDLIPRALARRVAGALGQRVLEGFAGLVTMLPAEVSMWRGDPALEEEAALQRAVRDWTERRTEALRVELARELEQLAAEAA